LQTKGRQAQRVNTVLSDAAVFFEIRICFVLSSYCRARFGFEYASFLLLIAGLASDPNTLRSFFLLPGSLRIRIRIVPYSYCWARFGFEYASSFFFPPG
ncbi:hypothetical protein, partial [Gorillibacterium sp. sgz5001074]|uniref:hypothetical protein n=1 Tax=Gorillibacterium sp. sgz5001074 TaxID=3446695 RepID=UPI003F66DBE0